MAIILLWTASMSACGSGSSLQNIDATIRFENIRKDARTDELVQVREILDKHSTRPALIDAGAARTVEGVEIRTVQAKVVLPTLRELDAIQADLEELAKSSDIADRPEFTLLGVSMNYRSNVVAAGVSVAVSGFASPGYAVHVYTEPGAEPMPTKAGRSGLWTVKISVIPESHWIYGVSIDPEGHDKPAYFRVNVSTHKQERVDPAEFIKLFGEDPKPAEPPKPAEKAKPGK